MLNRSVVPFLMAIAVSTSALAGALNPPAGPVAASGRFGPRIEINQTNTPGDADSLFKITQPGSYYLGGNVTGMESKHGIEIASKNVTVDLNGFVLQGVPASLNGVRNDFIRNNITVRNGVVTGWGQSGIDLISGGFSTNGLIELIHASSNGAYGVRGPRNAVIRQCTAESNADGIFASEGSVIELCTARLNSTSGISMTNGVVVRACQATSNGAEGIAGGIGCIVSNCSARSNGTTGISCNAGGSITHCTAEQNIGDGIHVTRSSVVNCMASLNTGDGIEAVSDCLILNNACDANGFVGDGAGIHITSSDNRIDGNSVTDNDRGIDLDFGGNITIRNTASGNTVNYANAVAQAIGPTITVTGTITSTNPWANFSY